MHKHKSLVIFCPAGAVVDYFRKCCSELRLSNVYLGLHTGYVLTVHSFDREEKLNPNLGSEEEKFSRLITHIKEYVKAYPGVTSKIAWAYTEYSADFGAQILRDNTEEHTWIKDEPKLEEIPGLVPVNGELF